MDMDRRNRISQWAFDTRAILGRFHLWLEDVDVRLTGEGGTESCSFVGGSLERAFVAAAAVTALGTRLFGRWGEGADLDKAGINRVKKDADAVSAYALSEGSIPLHVGLRRPSTQSRLSPVRTSVAVPGSGVGTIV